MFGDTSSITFKVPALEEDAKKLCFMEKQASAILEMRLYKLIGLEILALEKDYRETLKKIKEYTGILNSRARMDEVIKQDLDYIKKEFGLPRRTRIEDGKEAVYVEEPVQVRDVVFVMDRFGYCKILDKSVYEKNLETVETEHVSIVPCRTDDKICIFTDVGNLHQIKVADIPAGKLRDKGVPAENLSKFDGTREQAVYVSCTADMKDKNLIFATEMGMVKQVPASEFETNNRLVASTKLQEQDKVIAVVPAEGQTDIVLQTSSGVFLRFLVEEISVMKKNSKGVRGIKLADGEVLEQIYLIGENPVITYKKKEVHLNRLKMAKRDGKGSKVRL